MNWVNNHSNFSLLVKETALLFESGIQKCDFVITVCTSEDRINRVIKEMP